MKTLQHAATNTSLRGCLESAKSELVAARTSAANCCSDRSEKLKELRNCERLVSLRDCVHTGKIM